MLSHVGSSRKEDMVGLRRTVPYPLDSFIGRAEELEAVKALLTNHRVLLL